MEKKQAASQIARLSKKINELNAAYYLRDAPLVSDAEWDALMRELEGLEAKFPELRQKDSPTQRVGAPPSAAFKKFRHFAPMLSLANAMDETELMAFDERVKKLLDTDMELDYFSELKFDGLSINLVYIDGLLEHAATRGDGAEGEEVTDNVRTIKNVPLRLQGKQKSARVEVRGEIVLPLNAFQALNKEREENGEPVFANPRNAAAGSVRQLDSRLTAERDLRLYAYGIGIHEGLKRPASQSALSEQLMEWGFESTPYQRLCNGIGEVQKFYREIASARDTLPFDIDGIVVKLNSISLQEELGFISRSPRSMTAYKFPPRQEITQLREIQIQVGRTGVLTPVANLDPVVVHGVRVSRAALHNQEEIQRKDIRVGDWIVVQRAGDVIPEVVRVIPERRTGTERAFIFPAECPSCNSKVVKLENEVAIRCINPMCPAQALESLGHFVSKNAMDIVGLGPRILEQLVGAGLVRSFADLFELKEADLLRLEGFQKKSAQKLLAAIEASKDRSLAGFIHALGIRHVGEQLAKSLAKAFKSIDALMAASVEDLLAVEDIGEVVAKSIVEYFSNKGRIKDIERLKALGIHPKTMSTQGETLSGLTFVITGTLPKLSRQEASELIERNGGKVSSSVSKKTNFVLAGEEAGSKLEKAKELNVKVISEAELLEMTNMQNAQK